MPIRRGILGANAFDRALNGPFDTRISCLILSSQALCLARSCRYFRLNGLAQDIASKSPCQVWSLVWPGKFVTGTSSRAGGISVDAFSYPRHI